MTVGTLLLITAILIFAVIVAVNTASLLGNKTISFLKDIPAGAGGDKVSVIVAARNEAAKLSGPLKSLLAQDYKDLEVIAVDDRSDDATGRILDEMAAEDARLKVIHIKDLPAGWLGKNYALYTGSQAAGGKYLLFTDADVVMAPSAVSRAVSYMQRGGIDHLAVIPQVESSGFVLNMMVGTFLYLFFLGVKPWKARDKTSEKFVGIGAFNLVNAGCYRSAGTHKAIAMRVDDDMMLGRLVKKSGGRQDVLNGAEMVGIQWYPTVKAMANGMKKNAFAGADYNLLIAVFAPLAVLAVYVFPYIGLFIADGFAPVVFALTILLTIIFYEENARYYRQRPYLGVVLPVGVVILISIIWLAIAEALLRGGVYWRGTFYRLEELRKN